MGVQNMKVHDSVGVELKIWFQSNHCDFWSVWFYWICTHVGHV